MEGYRTIQELVLDRVRSWIVAGRFEPGQKLVQDDIANELGVSRMPVREAFRQLEAEGLVTMEPHKGVRVAALSVAEIKELHMIRSMLEGKAAELGAQRISDATLKKMTEVMAAMEKASSPEELMVHDKEFHSLLYGECGCRHLTSLISGLQDKSDPYLRTYMSAVDRREASLEAHRRLLAACERRDGEAAARLTRESLDRLARQLIEYLEERN